MAVLPANVLIADPTSDWMRLAVPLVITQDLAPARHLVPALVSDESGVYGAQGSDALRLTIEDQPRALELNATFTNTHTQRSDRVETLSTTAGDLIGTLDKLAHQIDSAAVPFGTHNPRALQSFSAGVFAPDLAGKIEHLKDAVSADASFGLAYSFLLEALAAAQNPELASVAAKADSQRASFTATDRARYDFVRARYLHAPLAQQAAAGLALTNLLPNDSDALVSAASVLFISGKAADASRLMHHALELNPGNANLEQQLGIGLLENREYQQAEHVLNQLNNDPAALPALATCVLLSGDRARATAIYERYLNTVPNNDAKTLLRASWQAHSGDRNSAIATLAQAQFQDPRLAAFAKTELIVFYLLNHDREAARKVTNAGPIAALLAVGASSTNDWRSKANALPDAVANANVKRVVIANGLFLYGFYDEAAAAWKQIDEANGGTDLRVRTMLAGSFARAGHASEAKQIAVQPFVPDLNDLFSVVSFSELRRLLGQAG